MELLLRRDVNKSAVESSCGRTPLHYAALGNQPDVADLLLRANPHLGVIVDANGETPLQLAVSQGRKEFIVGYARMTGTALKNLPQELPPRAETPRLGTYETVRGYYCNSI